MIKKEIGKRIANIRNNMGMTKEQFANLIGLSGQYLGTVERGKNGLTCEKIKMICEKTGVSADYIIMGKNASSQQFDAMIALSDFSQEQIEIMFNLMKKVALFLKTEGANELLIKEVFMSKDMQKYAK